MRREIDIFERYLDGSSLWRATVFGRREAQRRMREFAERSENLFFAIDLKDGRHLPRRVPVGDSRRPETVKSLGG